MKIQVHTLAAMIALFPALAFAKNTPDCKAAAPQASSDSAATLGFSRHKVTDFCTTAPRSEWLDEAEMKLLIQHRGYRVHTFKVSKTNCYEIYGFNKENRAFEAYFHPITTRLMLQNVTQ